MSRSIGVRSSRLPSCVREREKGSRRRDIVVPSVGIGETTLVHTKVRRKRIKSIKSKEARSSNASAVFICFGGLSCLFMMAYNLD